MDTSYGEKNVYYNNHLRILNLLVSPQPTRSPSTLFVRVIITITTALVITDINHLALIVTTNTQLPVPPNLTLLTIPPFQHLPQRKKLNLILSWKNYRSSTPSNHTLPNSTTKSTVLPTIEILVEGDQTAPKGAPTESRNDNTIDAAGIDNIVNTHTNSNSDDSLLLNSFLSSQKHTHIENFPHIINNNLQHATPTQQDRIIKGDVLTLSTLNVRSCNSIVRTSQTLDFFKLLDHDVIGLTETRHKSEANMKFNTRDNIHFSSFWNNPSCSMGGVGLLVKKTYADHIFKIHKEERLIFI